MRQTTERDALHVARDSQVHAVEEERGEIDVADGVVAD